MAQQPFQQYKRLFLWKQGVQTIHSTFHLAELVREMKNSILILEAMFNSKLSTQKAMGAFLKQLSVFVVCSWIQNIAMKQRTHSIDGLHIF